ncbi:MAG: PilT/PilU family type 4a pilus ATPase [Candidatus Omnitrophica bacterium]|nr:PilT/PilU family type 4a pilus ATPase [Candidatus Omnitrophota bacterium]
MKPILELLKHAVDINASDILLKVGAPPAFRKEGKLTFVEEDIITGQELYQVLCQLGFDEGDLGNKKREVDRAVELEGVGRFRATLYSQREGMGVVLRIIKSHIATFEELYLPVGPLQKLAFEKRGLVLVTGSTGSGKSTTIASLIEYVNQRANKHIITIEDPIEYIFQDKKSIISQREIGLDTLSYGRALRHAMLQSPDIIYIGNIRDQATMYAALVAAETGHLVLSTVHSINAAQTLERVVNFFPPHQHSEIRVQLSLLLKGILSQRLLPRQDKEGMMPVCEVLILTPTIARLIREGKVEEIGKFLEQGGMVGMQSFSQAIVQRFHDGIISKEVALEGADSKDEVTLAIEGIKPIRNL